MSPTRTLLTTAAGVGASVALLFSSAMATAEPAPGLPIDTLQAPGLPAMESLGPVIQQAAADPNNAASMLMAAAAVFAGDAAAPASSRDVASAVNQFVADPAAHVPAPGAVPGTQAHLPAGSTRRTRSDCCPRAPRRPHRVPRWPPLRWSIRSPSPRPHRHPSPGLRSPRRWPLRLPLLLRRPPERCPDPRPRLRRPPPRVRRDSVRTPRPRRTSCIRRSATDA